MAVGVIHLKHKLVVNPLLKTIQCPHLTNIKTKVLTYSKAYEPVI